MVSGEIMKNGEETRSRMLKQNKIKSKHGAAIIMALVVMTILIVLGLAVTTLSMGTLLSNSEDSENNGAYYAAEAGVTSAIEQVKYETSRYYAAMLESSGNYYSSLYNNFFYNIKSNSEDYFVEPDISGITTVTTFTTGTFDSVESVCEYIVSCKATSPDGAGYVVNGTVYIKKVNVIVSELYDWLSDGAAIKSGGTLDLESKNSVNVTGGDVLVEVLSYTETNDTPYTIVDGEVIIDPCVGSTMEDKLSYPSFTDPAISFVDLNITAANQSIDWDNIGEPPIGITSDVGLNLHFSSCTLPDGVVHIKGDVNLTDCVVEADLYVDGDLKIDNTYNFTGDIYCRGNIDIVNSHISGDIYSDGYVDVTNTILDSNVYSAAGIAIHNSTSVGNLYSEGEIFMDVSEVTGGIIYSSSKVTVGRGSLTAILFSGGDIEFLGDVTVYGAVYAIDDIFFKTDSNNDLDVSYTIIATNVDYIINDPLNSFFFWHTVDRILEENVFAGQDVTAEGRKN